MKSLGCIVILALTNYAMVNCQVREDCRSDLYSPKQLIEVPSQVVNLDLPAKQRWQHIVAPRKQQIKKFVRYLETITSSTMFNMITRYLGRGIGKFPSPYNEEIEGIAEAVGEPIGHIMACNIFYELEKFCTSIVVQDDEGNIFHGRNLDLGAWLGWDSKNDTWRIGELLRPLTVSVDFQSKGKTVFKTVQFAGTVGVFTGISPGKFSFSLNSRSPSHFLGGPFSVLSWLLSSKNDRQFASLLGRDVLENSQSYEDAKKRLSITPLLAPVYYIIAGTKPNQGVVITRSDTSSIKPMNLGKTTSLLVQTNYDNWKKPPFYDNRRFPALKCMKQLKKQSFKKNLQPHYKGIMYNVLSTIPVLNKATIYTTIMSPKSGEMLTNLRNCPGNCYPW